MRVAVSCLLLLPAATAAAAAEPQSPPTDGCKSDIARHAVAREPVRAQRLIDLPPGNLDLGVMRNVAGCPEPVTVAENFGGIGGPRRARPAERTPPPRPRPRLLGR